jgi:Tol biopolymer transport system component/N-acetylneuraminic acid mutarotase
MSIIALGLAVVSFLALAVTRTPTSFAFFPRSGFSSADQPKALQKTLSAGVVPTWSRAGTLAYAPLHHTATLLPSGQVLVTGGGNNSDKPELYDPMTNTWRESAPTVVLHRGHTATLLGNGKVLLVGGGDLGPFAITTEFYDPATDSWTVAPTLEPMRFGHTATLLPNGRVVIAGGDTNDVVLFDPITNAWILNAVGFPNGGRSNHTATLLQNGKVLFVGGQVGNDLLATAVLFNPATNSWTNAANMTNARKDHTATLLDNGKVLVAGGLHGFLPTSSAELYDPTSNTWSNAGNLNATRMSHTATLLANGKVLAAGGEGSASATSELYDPGTNSWSYTADLYDDRYLHTATLLSNGDVLVVGGRVYSDLPGAERYSQAGVSIGGPKIVFGGGRGNGNRDVYTMDLDGANPTRLTSEPAYDDQPKWSPDGSKIVFMSDRDGNFEIYSMNADGSNQTRLTNSLGGDGFPAWSPDGTKIVFTSGDMRNPATFEIYTMNADGTNRTRLTNDNFIDGVPAWSPDGTKIVFMSGGSSVFDINSFEIFVINADGSNRTRLTNNTVVDGQPSFSPDGSRILFGSGSGLSPNGIEIFVMNADGSNRTQLTNNAVTDGFPAWSPDGTKIIFASGSIADENGVELFVMNADGTNRIRLTKNVTLDWFADWQPSTAPPWQPVTLAANQIELKVWTVQGRTYAYVKPQFPNGGYRVVNWGLVARSGNDFSVDASVERFIGPSMQSVVSTAQIYDLGPLANGTYNFNFKTSGALSQTLQFIISSTVPPSPANPIDNAREFVRQQYRDFLNREADQAGENFWTDNITKCTDPARRPPTQTVEQCTLRQREITSGAFFLSPEFQYTGYYVYRVYKGALGRPPKLSEFIPDALFVGKGIVVNGQLSAAEINQNKRDYASKFANCADPLKSPCAEFKATYDPLSNEQYVDKLFQTTGVNASSSDRAALVNGLNANSSTETRATVLLKVVDGINVISEGNQQFTTTYGQAFYNAEFRRAFVQLEYFGYMKRDPDEAGYAFWLGKLNQFNGDFVAAEMVLAFISSPEYRARFGQP